jgi:hypothetical protein
MRRLTVIEFGAVKRALAAGMRHTEIAREFGLSLWTIARVADDLRLAREEPATEALPEDDAPPGYISQNLRRCTSCGGMIYLWPCLACRMGTATRAVPLSESGPTL